MYKISKLWPRKAQMVDVSELHNLDYGFEAYATQGFTFPMDVPIPQLAG